jgi:hypothetical protein
MTARRFPPPWTVEDIGGSFVVKASNDRPLVFIYYWDGVGRRSLAKLLTAIPHDGLRQASRSCRTCCAGRIARRIRRRSLQDVANGVAKSGSRFNCSRHSRYKLLKLLVGPGVVPRQSKINNLNCQTDLTAAMGAKGIFLHCQTGKITPRLLLTRS